MTSRVAVVQMTLKLMCLEIFHIVGEYGNDLCLQLMISDYIAMEWLEMRWNIYCLCFDVYFYWYFILGTVISASHQQITQDPWHSLEMIIIIPLHFGMLLQPNWHSLLCSRWATMWSHYVSLALRSFNNQNLKFALFQYRLPGYTYFTSLNLNENCLNNIVLDHVCIA